MNIVCVALEEELPQELPPGFTKLVTGVGKINATYTLTEALAKTVGIKNIINYGTAGGSPNMQGNLIQVSSFLERDMDTTAIGTVPYQTLGEIDTNIYTFGNFRDRHNIWEGVVCGTGDSFSEPKPRDYQLVDMEGYALAKVARRFQKPFYSYKYVSDSGDADDWKANVAKGSELFLEKVKLFA